MKLTYGSLFSGIGGFDLGFDRAGMRCAWQCEIDTACRSVLSRHWPDAMKVEDVRHVGRDLPSVDVVCGGFPCQDVSVAGRRAGLAGERSGLWYEFRRIVDELHPQWVVVENVPGLLSSNGGADFAVILRGLVECGYGVAWRVLDAQYFGVPQRRRRVFIVGSLGDGRAAQVLFERESVPGDTPPSRGAGTRAARSLANGAVSSGYRYDPNGEELIPFADISDALFAAMGTKWNGNAAAFNGSQYVKVAHILRAEGHDASEDGTGRGVPLVVSDVAPTLTGGSSGTAAHNKQNGSDRGAGVVAFDMRGRDAGAQFEGPHDTANIRSASGGSSRSFVAVEQDTVGLQMNFIRRPRIGDYVGSLSAQPGDAQFNGLWDRRYGVRRLTPVECERLQGFEDGWTAGQADSARYRQLGNAVAVPVAAWIGRRIVEVRR